LTHLAEGHARLKAVEDEAQRATQDTLYGQDAITSLY
jgi:hypothetical protein